MKRQIATFIFAICSAGAVQAASIKALQCTGMPDHFTSFRLQGIHGYLIHNYSDATLVCSSAAYDIYNKVKTISCYGAWTYDFDRKSGQSLSTMAWIEIKNDGQKITARTQTNKVYGSVVHDLNCETLNIKEAP